MQERRDVDSPLYSRLRQEPSPQTPALPEGHTLVGKAPAMEYRAAAVRKKSIRLVQHRVGPEPGAPPWNRQTISILRKQLSQLARASSGTSDPTNRSGHSTRLLGTEMPRSAASRILRIN